MDSKTPTDVVEALSFQQPFLFGTIKAQETVAKLHTAWGDLEAWKAELKSGRLSRRIVLWAVQRFRHPEDYRNYQAEAHLEAAREPSMRWSPEDRVEAVEAARVHVAREEIKAEPPPPEYHEALKKLRERMGKHA